MLISGLILGLILGFIFQRGRFCVTGAFRDVWLSRSTRWFNAFLLAIALQSVIVVALAGLGIVSPEVDKFAPFAVSIGSLLFGVGIVLSGGCATGTYYRAGEGLVGSWIALVLYALSSSVLKFGLGAGLTKKLRGATVNATTVYDTLGVPWWALSLLLAVGVAYLVIRELAATPKVAALPAKKTGVAHFLFEKKWHPYFTATLVGLLAAVAFPLSSATGRNAGLGITTPSAKLIQFLTTADISNVDWGVLLILGLIPGSYLAAKLSGEFRVRVPDARTAVRAVWGGLLMGVGAVWAGGCTIGNSLVDTALFGWQGWTAFLFTFLGVGLGARLFIQNHTRAGATLQPQPVLENA